MTNRLNDAVGAAKGVYESAAVGAGAAATAAATTATAAATTAKTTAFDVAKAVAGIAATIGAIGFDDVLGWVGLARKRSPLTTLAFFGAGIAVGAGVAALLSPTSGPALRREILARLDGLKRQATQGVEQAEHQIQSKVGGAVDAVKGAVSSSESGNSHYGAEGSGRQGGESGHHLS
ncbi:YtxH domain-containing protein [Sorangium sp. So ce291]|uniref:YtxH domain-containing protein n=1 Tax=Sorangium sp. So ce291 TaxID=3133294 RepID=UPI003F5F38F4